MTDVDVPFDTSGLDEPTTGVHSFGGGSGLDGPQHQIISFNPNDRRHFIGGSDARIIMGDDQENLIRLWREKRGEIEPQDLADNLIVQLGTVGGLEPRLAPARERSHGEQHPETCPPSYPQMDGRNA